jgi:uncharacterized glyoxalase superfamily protein PhnB
MQPTRQEIRMLPNRSMPSSTLIPVLVYEDVAEAIEWLCDTFGFTERWRAGDHRAQLTFGDGAVAITERRIAPAAGGGDPTILRPPRRGEVSHSIMVRVEDVDSHYTRARHAGARILGTPQDFPYGERQYSAEDLEGHRWTFSQSIADVAPEAWGGVSAGR